MESDIEKIMEIIKEFLFKNGIGVYKYNGYVNSNEMAQKYGWNLAIECEEFDRLAFLISKIIS